MSPYCLKLLKEYEIIRFELSSVLSIYHRSSLIDKCYIQFISKTMAVRGTFHEQGATSLIVIQQKLLSGISYLEVA